VSYEGSHCLTQSLVQLLRQISLGCKLHVNLHLRKVGLCPVSHFVCFIAVNGKLPAQFSGRRVPFLIARSRNKPPPVKAFTSNLLTRIYIIHR
jgi:hypothetical protein